MTDIPHSVRFNALSSRSHYSMYSMFAMFSFTAWFMLIGTTKVTGHGGNLDIAVSYLKIAFGVALQSITTKWYVTMEKLNAFGANVQYEPDTMAREHQSRITTIWTLNKGYLSVVVLAIMDNSMTQTSP